VNEVVEERVHEVVEERVNEVAEERGNEVAEERVNEVVEDRVNEVVQERANEVVQERVNEVVEERVNEVVEDRVKKASHDVPRHGIRIPSLHVSPHLLVESRERHDFLFEVAFRGGAEGLRVQGGGGGGGRGRGAGGWGGHVLLRLHVRLECEIVHLLTGDAVLFSDDLGSFELTEHPNTTLLKTHFILLSNLLGHWETVLHLEAVGNIRTDGDLGHAFDTGGDDDILHTGHHSLGGEVDGLLGRATLAIHGSAGDSFGKLGGEDDIPADIAGLCADLADAAHDDCEGEMRQTRNERVNREYLVRSLATEHHQQTQLGH
jgi:hypothetical protein